MSVRDAAAVYSTVMLGVTSVGCLATSHAAVGNMKEPGAIEWFPVHPNEEGFRHLEDKEDDREAHQAVVQGHEGVIMGPREIVARVGRDTEIVNMIAIEKSLDGLTEIAVVVLVVGVVEVTEVVTMKTK